MTTRNHVWSNNGDIANDLEWPLTALVPIFVNFEASVLFPSHFFRRLQTVSTDLHEIWYDDAYFASEPDRKLKFPTFKNPRWRSLTDEHLTEQHWQPVFLFSKPIVSIHVCCSYIELSRSKLHKTGDLQVGNWHVNCQHSSCKTYVEARFAVVVSVPDCEATEMGKDVRLAHA